MKPIAELYPTLFFTPGKVVIVPHAKPDADAFGAALAWGFFLQKLGHKTQIIAPTNWATSLNFLPDMARVMNAEFEIPTAKTYVEKADYFFALDWNTWSRIHNMQSWYPSIKAVKVLIDHHELPDTDRFDFGLSQPFASSTSEMILDIITEMGKRQWIDKEMATALYAGILSDTGSFRYSNVRPILHEKIAFLLSQGVEHTHIHERLFDTNTALKLQFIGHVLSHSLDLRYEGKVAVVAVAAADLVKYKIKTGDTEGLLQYPMSLADVEFVALFTDRTEEIRVSFRSKSAKYDVNRFARLYFSGGGHKMAAGGTRKGTLEEVVAYFWECVALERGG